MIIMVNDHHLYEELLKITTKENVLVNQPLKDYTYTRFGGQAYYLVTPETYQEVQQIGKLANENNIAFTLLGNGSNLIIKDGGIRGIVMNLSKLNMIETNDEMIIAQSG